MGSLKCQISLKGSLNLHVHLGMLYMHYGVECHKSLKLGMNRPQRVREKALFRSDIVIIIIESHQVDILAW